uniref:Uncharacterized protein n=1 Tax=Rhizophora mucronata TaxID=61149 RepID=A0A2P2JGF7_RHIMU
MHESTNYKSTRLTLYPSQPSHPYSQKPCPSHPYCSNHQSRCYKLQHLETTQFLSFSQAFQMPPQVFLPYITHE